MTDVWDQTFDKRMEKIFGKEFALAYDIDSLCQDLRGSIIKRHENDQDPGSIPHIVLFVRAWRLWHAVVRLARQGYAAEAPILTRAIWETRINLGYLCADFKKRSRQFNRYRDLFVRVHAVHIAAERPYRLEELGIPQPDIPSIANRIREFAKDFGGERMKKRLLHRNLSDDDLLRSFSSVKNWMMLSLKDAARSFGAEAEYEVFYPPTSRVAHVGHEGIVGFTWYHDGKSIIEAGPTVKGADHVLVTGGQFMVALVNEIDDVLRFGFADRIQVLNRRLLDLITNTVPIEIRLGKLLNERHSGLLGAPGEEPGSGEPGAPDV